jgi:heme-degrading monooxygenase HmoA
VSVVSVLRIVVSPGVEDDFVREFRELGVFDHSARSGGFVDGRLLRPLGAGEPFVVIAEWEDAPSYEAWLANPVREELKEKLDRLVAEDVPHGGLYVDVER